MFVIYFYKKSHSLNSSISPKLCRECVGHKFHISVNKIHKKSKEFLTLISSEFMSAMGTSAKSMVPFNKLSRSFASDGCALPPVPVANACVCLVLPELTWKFKVRMRSLKFPAWIRATNCFEPFNHHKIYESSYFRNFEIWNEIIITNS